MPVGETVFRPSSRADHLTATVKLTAHGPLLHVDILEKDINDLHEKLDGARAEHTQIQTGEAPVVWAVERI